MCDFHPTYIGQLERGEKNATLESVNRLCRGLGISLDELLKDIDTLNSSFENVALEVYHNLIRLPKSEQEKVASIVFEIIELIQNAR